MEHRWGQRVGVDLPVRVTANAFSVRPGRLSNLSVSGAYIRADYDLRILARISVAIELPFRSKHQAEIVDAYVARKYRDGIGIEWCEFSPPAICRLLETVSVRRYVRLRKPESPAAIAIARLSQPLLKHGT